MDKPAIEVDGIGKEFRIPNGLFRRRTVTALKEVTFSVGRGEAFGLIGPNGSGKSTLLAILSTVLLPSSGRARVGGISISEENRIKPLIGVIPPDPRGFAWRSSAFQNLEFYAVLQNLPSLLIHRRIGELLEIVDLSPVKERPIWTYSTGYLQRLNVARALLHDPPILLFDEPSLGLDPWLARSFRKWVREELIGRRKKTLLVATNQLDDVHQMCDRAALLEEGRLVWQGPAAEAA